MNAMNPRFNPEGASIEGVFHRIRLVPVLSEKRHISEITDNAYWGAYNDFTWQDLALNPPVTVGVSETEEQDGEIWFTFRTAEPMDAIGFVARIADRFITLNVIHDYELMERELFGRLWYRNGLIYKQCHLTPLQPFLRGI
ncbi:hypothetical protein [Arthrobacter sp. SO3]|uniref:hypothetical protein n=1 Tax=Arthrobacter sp. SO3 TaxID=1897057 RepID=UPI001CFFE559|nr:hypothetical protein [Arthrobacter sp. SO3]